MQFLFKHFNGFVKLGVLIIAFLAMFDYVNSDQGQGIQDKIKIFKSLTTDDGDLVVSPTKEQMYSLQNRPE